jgi:hypothetical protein
VYHSFKISVAHKRRYYPAAALRSLAAGLLALSAKTFKLSLSAELLMAQPECRRNSDGASQTRPKYSAAAMHKLHENA